MAKHTRRNFLKTIGLGAAAGGAAIGLGSLLLKGPVTQEEYASTQQTIKDLGLDIDEEHSTFKEGSETLIVYLPDVHTQGYAISQKKRIKKLDRAIDFDIIGLEGIVGSVNVKEIKALLEQRGSFWHKNTIGRRDSIFERFVNGPIDYEINDSDSKPIKLQKLRIKLEDAITFSDFMFSPSFERDKGAYDRDLDAAGWDHEKVVPSSEASTRYQLWSSFQRELRMLKETTPQKEGGDRDPVSAYILWKEFQNSKPRINAPGLFYFDLETRASKLGLESSEVEEKKSGLSEAYNLQLNISRINQLIEKVRKSYEKVKSVYANLSTEDEQKESRDIEKAFKEFTFFYSSYVKDMADFRDELLSNFSFEIRNSVLECKYDSEQKEETMPIGYDELVIRARSEQWVKNASSKRIVLMIGGAGHTDTIYESTKDEDCSIISLKKLQTE